MRRESLKEVLMRRDGLSEDEAQISVDMAREEIHEIIANDGSYDEAVDYMQSEFGLEPDYLEDLIF